MNDLSFLIIGLMKCIIIIIMRISRNDFYSCLHHCIDFTVQARWQADQVQCNVGTYMYMYGVREVASLCCSKCMRKKLCWGLYSMAFTKRWPANTIDFRQVSLYLVFCFCVHCTCVPCTVHVQCICTCVPQCMYNVYRGTVHVYQCMYNRTSDSGHSEKGTLYCKPLNKGHWSWSQITQFPIVFIQIKPPRRGQPLYKGQNPIVYWVPKCPLFRGSAVHVQYGALYMCTKYMYMGTVPDCTCPRTISNQKNRNSTLAVQLYCS